MSTSICRPGFRVQAAALLLPLLLLAPLAGATGATPLPASSGPTLCDPANVSLVYDVDADELYLETDIGPELLTTNELTIALDTSNSADIEVEFTSRNWDGEVDEDGVYVGTYATFRGVFNYTVVSTVDTYDFLFDPGTQAIPTIPLVIKTDKQCPPDD